MGHYEPSIILLCVRRYCRYLSKKNIDVPLWITQADEAKIKIQVDRLLKNVAAEANMELQQNYENGGEARAYASGKSAYLARAAAIKQRAEDEGWPIWE